MQTISEFIERWKQSGGVERANYGLFLNDLTKAVGLENRRSSPRATRMIPAGWNGLLRFQVYRFFDWPQGSAHLFSQAESVLGIFKRSSSQTI